MFNKRKKHEKYIEELRKVNRFIFSILNYNYCLIENYKKFCHPDTGNKIINTHLITYEENGKTQLSDILIVTGVIRTDMNYSSFHEGVLYKSLQVDIVLFIHSMKKQHFKSEVLRTYGKGNLHSKSFWIDDILCFDPDKGIGSLALDELKRLCRMYGLETIAGQMSYGDVNEKNRLVSFYKKNVFSISDENDCIRFDLT